MIRLIAFTLLVASGFTLSGCALSRADQLARQSGRVESHLLKERDQALAATASESAGGGQSARLSHINALHTQLTVADVARKVAPRLLTDPAQVESAYDVLEEVYSTIDWNIPLMPTDAAVKPMPALFGPGGLDFTNLQPKAPQPR